MNAEKPSCAKWTLAVGFLVFMTGVLLAVTNSRLAMALRHASFDWLQDLPTTSRPSGNLVLVYLDESSHRDLGQPLNKPWDRALHARLLDHLAEDGARAVVFDIIFSDKGPDPAADSLFEEAIKRNGHVILAADLVENSVKFTEQASFTESTTTLPYEPFRKAAKAWGFCQLNPSEDLLVREHFHGVRGSDYASLSWAAAAALGSPATKDPTARFEERWINYYGGPGSIGSMSYKVALDAPKGTFQGKVVVVGGKPTTSLLSERKDEFKSPYTPWYKTPVFLPAVDVHAMELQNLIRRDWVKGVPPIYEYLLFAGAALFFGWVVGQHPPLKAALLSVVGVAVVVSMAALVFVFAHIWIPFLIVVAVQAPAGLLGLFVFKSAEWFNQKRAAHERIREQASLLDEAQDAIMVYSHDTTTYWNQSAERIYGWTADEVRTHGIVSLLFDDDQERFAKTYAAAIATGWAGELEQSTKTGRKLVVQSRWSPLLDESGAQVGVLIINTNITQQKKMEEQLRHAERTKVLGILAGGLVHDLNNVLTPIEMSAHILQLEASTEKQRNLLRTIEISSQRGADMARQMLAFARGYEGEKVVLHPKHIIREIVKIATETFPKQITIKMEIAPDLHYVRGNPTQLHQALLNLVLNARDALPKGGTICVEGRNGMERLGEDTSETRSCAVISVSDDGSGIPPEIAEHIFDPFFTTKEPGKGTGLGLWVVMSTAKSHHGKVSFVTKQSRGSTFTIALPAAEDEKAAESETPSVSVVRGSGQTIVVCDRDPLVRALIEVVLDRHNYVVVQGENIQRVLQHVQEHAKSVSVVIIDESMTDSGQMVCKNIKAIAPQIKCISLHGATQPSPDADASLQKPFTAQTLLQTLSTTLHG